MSTTLPELPDLNTPDPAGDYARAQAWAMLLAKQEDAGGIAQWAASFLANQLIDLDTALSDQTVNDKIASLMLLLDQLGDFTVGTVNYSDSGFTDSMLDTLKTRFGNDLAGATAAEAALYARHSSRTAAENTKAYNQITAQYSTAGWDMPPGALLAKQTELVTEGNKRLTDASADIMATSAKEATQGALQIIDLLGRMYDNKVMREFEASKLEVQLGVEGYKSTLAAIQTKAELATKGAELSINASLHQMSIKVQTLQGLAQAALQLIASALGTVHSSTSFGFSGSAGTSYDGDITTHSADKRYAIDKGVAAP